jgi:hypothetical protein
MRYCGARVDVSAELLRESALLNAKLDFVNVDQHKFIIFEPPFSLFKEARG